MCNRAVHAWSAHAFSNSMPRSPGTLQSPASAVLATSPAATPLLFPLGAPAVHEMKAEGVGVHSIWPCGTCGPTGMVRRQPPRRYMTWPESQEFGRAGPNIKHGLGRPCAQVLSPRAPVQSTTRVLLTMHGVRSSRSPRFIGTTIFYEVCLFSIHKLS